MFRRKGSGCCSCCGCLPIILLVGGGCVAAWWFYFKPEVVYKDLAQARDDGFKVLIVTKTQGGRTVDTMSLAEAETTVKDNPSVSFLINAAETERLEKALELKLQKAAKSRYPFVRIVVSADAKDRQTIDLAFYYRKDTRRYCYEARKKRIRPLWFRYREGRVNRKTIYKPKTTAEKAP